MQCTDSTVIQYIDVVTPKIRILLESSWVVWHVCAGAGVTVDKSRYIAGRIVFIKVWLTQQTPKQLSELI